ncbi:Polysaccharide deacetylase [[Clostridium] ultunense Esp]|nr:Polysaccharide deacetylase [[Clostridium] ultunense Esp]
MGKVFWGIFFLLFIYMGVPFLLTRVFGIGVIKRGSSLHRLAFTFDDGPDPVYTPRLLELLRTYGVKATFFVVGEKAKRHPELIRRIHEEGHAIGIHNYVHHPNWFLSPLRLRRDLDETAAYIQSITGERPLFYRPPWGLLSLADLFLLRPYRLTIWSLMGWDWGKKTSPVRLRMRLLHKIRGGEIILLHDSGETAGADPTAPERMMIALEETLREIRHWGYEYVPLNKLMEEDEDFSVKRMLPFWKRGFAHLFILYDKALRFLLGVRPIQKRDDFFYVRVIHYHGQRIGMEDGETIEKGDLILEIHLNNELLFKLGLRSRSRMQLVIQLIREVEKSLPVIAELLETHPKYRLVKGLYGISLVNRGVKPFGFSVLDLPKGLLSHLIRYYLRFLMFAVHPRGGERLKTKTDLLVPKIMVMSRKEILKRYGKGKESSPLTSLNTSVS